MKLTPNFSSLEELVRRAGATPISWNPRAVDMPPVDADVKISEVEPRHGGLLTYGGRQIVLYIKDGFKDRDTLVNRPEEAQRFHIAECRTIEEMRAGRRFDRYVATNRKDGKFRVHAMENRQEIEAALRVCKNCLKHVDWPGRWTEFSLEEFLSEHSCFFHFVPRYTDESSPPAGYAIGWGYMARRIKARADWRCQGCGVDCSGPADRRLLHAHHKDGVKRHNHADNLAVLCADCHSRQPKHEHMNPDRRHLQRIDELRRRQGLAR